jgi:hypothetical protein
MKIETSSALASATVFGLLAMMAMAISGVCLAEAGTGGVIQGTMDFPEMLPTFESGHYSPGVPGIDVFVRNKSTGLESVRVKTDSRGTFVIPNQPAGDYFLCWDQTPGTTSGCGFHTTGGKDKLNEPFSVIDHVATRWISGYVTPKPNAVTVRGVVAMPGGAPSPWPPALNGDAILGRTSCNHFDPFFDVDATATVELYSGDTLLSRVRANSAGEYMLAYVPPLAGAADYRLKVGCEGNLLASPVTFSASPLELVARNVELPANHAPQIGSLQATVRNRPVQGVPPGTRVKVTVTVQDQEGDTLHFRWKATAGSVVSQDASSVFWRLPATGKGLHFLYVLVSDGKGGYQSQRVAISTDKARIVPAVAEAAPDPKPSDAFKEADRFLAHRGIDTRQSACEYYRVIKAANGCDAQGNPIRAITFQQWRKRNGFKLNGKQNPNRPRNGELTAAFRNEADLNLVRDHHARRVGSDRIAYYVCNHAQKPGDNLPAYNLVACVGMEHSALPGVNGGQPFTRFYTFGPTGKLYLSVNLDGRGEKYMPGVCVPCHGGDGYFNRFPEAGATAARDSNIGAYFEPFDLDNFAFGPAPFGRDDQEEMVRKLNVLLKETDPTPAMVQLIDGWYPGGAGKQQSEYLPPGWNPELDETLPRTDRINPFDNTAYTFNTDQLYLKAVKPACRLCHITMGTKLGLDFNRYRPNVDRTDPACTTEPSNPPDTCLVDDPQTPPDDRVGSFVNGFSTLFSEFNDSGNDSNALHSVETTCHRYGVLTGNLLDAFEPPTYNLFDNTNQPAHTMPNAIATFDRFWQNPVEVGLLREFMKLEEAPGVPDTTDCESNSFFISE